MIIIVSTRLTVNIALDTQVTSEHLNPNAESRTGIPIIQHPVAQQHPRDLSGRLEPDEAQRAVDDEHEHGRVVDEGQPGPGGCDGASAVLIHTEPNG